MANYYTEAKVYCQAIDIPGRIQYNHSRASAEARYVVSFSGQERWEREKRSARENG
jgi:hypothetical protein